MSDLREATGSCLCGSVQFSAKQVGKNIGACHCNMCRKWGGGAYLSIDCGTDVTFTGEQSIDAYDSSQWAERGFCKQCGTHLFYRLKTKQHYFMPVGLLNEQNDLTMDHQIFIDEKPDYYCFSNETKNMTGAESMAEFAAAFE